ncbi:MAG: glycoside hydrolase family 2 protein [Acutalibacteraceae bacterium]
MRKVTNINNGWSFFKGPYKNGKAPKKAKKSFEPVSLPHTWNNLDGQDGGSDYYRNTCWYCRELKFDDLGGRDVYIEFEGVSSVCEVYAFGKKIARHEGGFSTFRVNLTPYIRHKKIKLSVMADNSESNRNIYPGMADFTFYGGIYRDVKLIEVDKIRFDLDYFGTPGVSVTEHVNPDGSADVEFCAYVTGGESVTFTADGRSVSATVSKNTACAVMHFDSPHLWDGVDDPYLYEVKAELKNADNITDCVSVCFGIRSFSVDPEKGFILNGRPYPLHGVSRHQDRENMGWAITEKEHKEDMELIKEVGANTIRLAHYQHSQCFYDLCDEAGMIVWAEIPFISAFVPTPEARENTLSQMKELVLQNYNHPSIVCWGIANEISIGGETPELIENLEALNSLCHELDKTRLTTIANLTMVEMDSKLNFITDILSYNHYFGWYMGDVSENGPWLDEFHKLNPERCIGLSEYGCEGILKYHTDEPKRQDYTEEYQAYYHEKMLETFATRPYIWSTHVWNMFDFGSDMRDEGGVKGRNNKGLVTYDRKTKKDSFYIYKAWWSKEGFVHLCSSRYRDRVIDTISIKAYSNQSEVTLFVNGERFGSLSADKVFVFESVMLKKGDNKIKAVAGEYSDEMTLVLTDTPNESYVLQASENDGKNWFEGMSTDGEMTFDSDYFCVKDKLGDIMKTEEGSAFVGEMIDKVSAQMNMNVSKGMLQMAKGFTIERIFDMAGDRMTPEVKVWVNQKLQKIKK